ncbi:MAG: Phosphate acetyltransferase, partial [Candidatus Peregrinibacteria bacterium GW2011_GWA2_44_7]
MIHKTAKELGIDLPWEQIEIIDTQNDSRQPHWEKRYQEIRKISLAQAKEEMAANPINIIGTLLVEEEKADGMISGATFTTAETIRPAIQIIGTKEKFHKVSGFFFMILEERILLFADCAVIIEPNSHELADIAIDTAETALRFGLEPKIAMLSFSTAGS